MYKHLIVAALLALPIAIGCTGAPPPPTSVTEDERQQMLEQEKQVEAAERAQQAQNK